MNKRHFLFTFLMIGAIVLSACGGTSNTADNNSNTADDTADEPDVDPEACNLAAPDEATEINMIGWSFEIMDFYAAEFEKCS